MGSPADPGIAAKLLPHKILQRNACQSCRCNLVPASIEVAGCGGGALYLRLPATMALRTPSRVSCLAKRLFCVSTRSKRENTGLDRLESQAQRLPERGDMRPLTRTSGIFLSLASTIRFGQNSDSVKSAAQKPHVAHPQRLQTNAKSKAMLGFTRPPYPLIV
jgi:hypothetical protein